jgi:hypothetical protein
MIFLMEGYALVATYSRSLNSVIYYDAYGNKTVHRLFFYSQPLPGLDVSLEWLRRQAYPGDVIATSMPHLAYLRTGLKAVLPPMVVDREEAQHLLDSVPVRYVVVDNWDYPDISRRYAAPVVEKHPDLWKCIYIAPGGQAQIYERIQ